jgi:hypothetical protein
MLLQIVCIYTYKFAQCHNPEDRHRYRHRRENLKSRMTSVTVYLLPVT